MLLPQERGVDLERFSKSLGYSSQTRDDNNSSTLSLGAPTLGQVKLEPWDHQRATGVSAHSFCEITPLDAKS